MKGRLTLLLALLVLAWPAVAQDPPDCRVAEHIVETSVRLPQASRAIAGKKLDIVVVGAGSSALPGPDGAKKAYPARLQEALAAKLPNVKVTVFTDIKARRTAAEMLQGLPGQLAAKKPALLVWQSGTVDAMLSVDIDQYSQALEKGLNIARAAGSDVIFVNSQYSPRTESIIALGTYSEAMRWVAVQQEVPVFDRFSIMKTWADLGTFDLYSATKKLDIAERVHDCIGRLLAGMIVEASQTPPSQGMNGR